MRPLCSTMKSRPLPSAALAIATGFVSPAVMRTGRTVGHSTGAWLLASETKDNSNQSLKRAAHYHSNSSRIARLRGGASAVPESKPAKLITLSRSVKLMASA